MSDIRLTFMVLKLLELVIFCIFGYLLSKSKSKGDYWIRATVPILAYSIITGLRFGRWVDWNLYYTVYIGLGENINYTDHEFLFRNICNMMYNIGVPYPMFIMLQCAFLMFAILLLVSNYRKQAAFILPLVLPLIWFNENYIRWYIAVGFFLISLNSMIKGNKKWMFVWFACSFLNHAGIIVFLPVLVFHKLIDMIIIDRRIAIGLLFVTCFLVSISQFSFMTYISDYLSSIGFGGDSRVSGYLDKTEDLISGNFGAHGIKEKSFVKNFHHFIGAAPIVWFAKDLVVKYRYGVLFYNLFVIGAIVFVPFTTVEIFSRYALALYFFTSISGGILFFYIWRYRRKINIVISSICLICFLSIVYKTVFAAIDAKPDNEMLFVWDARGRDRLY